MNCLMKRPLFCAWLAVVSMVLAGTARAQQDTFLNDHLTSYPGTEPFPPMIDATNFINTSQFIINFTTGDLNSSMMLYETWDTVNYTNTGTMMANSGFQFDTLFSGSGLHARAGSFNNSKTISCGSVNDTGDPLLGELALLGYAACVIDATNVLNPGLVDVGGNGLIQITGQNVDLSRSSLLIEGNGANTSGSSDYGTNNPNATPFFAWDPSVYLGPTFAITSPFAVAPGQLALDNSTAYFDSVPHQINGTNVYRAVFIQDNSGPNVSTSVYFDTPNLGGDLGSGNVTIQWAGSYVDAATGNTYSNYLYLNNNYVLGASTNVLPLTAIPRNFTITESPTPLPLPIGTYPALPDFSPYLCQVWSPIFMIL